MPLVLVVVAAEESETVDQLTKRVPPLQCLSINSISIITPLSSLCYLQVMSPSPFHNSLCKNL